MNELKVQAALRSFMGMSRLNQDDIMICDVKPLREDLKRGLRGVEFKACFNNAYRYATDYNGKYCLGYGMSVIPVEHAWVKLGDDYYDPTWEKYSDLGLGYASIIELDHIELFEIIEANNMTPPSIWDLVRLGIISPSTVDPLELMRNIDIVT